MIYPNSIWHLLLSLGRFSGVPEQLGIAHPPTTEMIDRSRKSDPLGPQLGFKVRLGKPHHRPALQRDSTLEAEGPTYVDDFSLYAKMKDLTSIC